MVENVDGPREPGVEADEEVDRRRDGFYMRSLAAGVDGHAVDAPAPLVFCDGSERWRRSREGMILVVQWRGDKCVRNIVQVYPLLAKRHDEVAEKLVSQTLLLLNG